jgi:hypothetical protein
MKKKIVFLHGFFASGSCIPANALRDALADEALVLTPDLPLRPCEVLSSVRRLIDDECPDLLVGNSCGSFYAQMLASEKGLPALLGNPHFEMDRFLMDRIGAHQYKSPRQDGNQTFVITEELAREFRDVQAVQFDNCRDELRDRVWGIFGEKDTLAHYEPLFLSHYSHAFHFPGGHTPTADEVMDYYVPLVKDLLKINTKA